MGKTVKLKTIYIKMGAASKVFYDKFEPYVAIW